MIVGNKFVFVTTPKTAWAFTREFLKQNFSFRNVRKYIKDLNKKASNKFIFGNVRNPWDYYVSWYHFHKKENGIWFKSVMGESEKTFENFIKNMSTYSGVKKANVQWDLDKSLLENGLSLKGEKVGLYTLLYISFFSKKQ